MLIAAPSTGGGAGFKAVASAMEVRPPTPGSSRAGGSFSAASPGGDGGEAPRRHGGWLNGSFDQPERMSGIRKGVRVPRLQLRTPTGAEVSRVLGGGVMPDSLILVRCPVGMLLPRSSTLDGAPK